jgi:hypothetical protein
MCWGQRRNPDTLCTTSFEAHLPVQAAAALTWRAFGSVRFRVESERSTCIGGCEALQGPGGVDFGRSFVDFERSRFAPPFSSRARAWGGLARRCGRGPCRRRAPPSRWRGLPTGAHVELLGGGGGGHSGPERGQGRQAPCGRPPLSSPLRPEQLFFCGYQLVVV